MFLGPSSISCHSDDLLKVFRDCRKLGYLLKNSVIKTYKLTSCLRIEACFSRSVEPFRLFAWSHEELHDMKNQMISNNCLCHFLEWHITNLHIFLKLDTGLIWERIIIEIYFVPSFFVIWTDFNGFCEGRRHWMHETNVMLSSFLHANSHPDSHFPLAKFQCSKSFRRFSETWLRNGFAFLDFNLTY
jgi:hypothetical protein